MAAQIARAIEDYGGKATIQQMGDFWECSPSTLKRRVERLLDSGFWRIWANA